MSLSSSPSSLLSSLSMRGKRRRPINLKSSNGSLALIWLCLVLLVSILLSFASRVEAADLTLEVIIAKEQAWAKKALERRGHVLAGSDYLQDLLNLDHHYLPQEEQEQQQQQQLQLQQQPQQGERAATATEQKQSATFYLRASSIV